ncbi:MAG: aspartate aminotransferase [Omnitrophica bacterium RIFCSPHIGHO2_02_FULL_51_18]|nr:MAG: aspartate aminotransferase [Omnitrophica bacterium RIFCSPHIGHO2_02_FULL_51_18]
MTIAGRMTLVSPSATLQLTSKAKEMKSKGLPVINFAAGEPDFDTPQAVKDEAVKCLNSGFTKYTPSSGIPELKEAVCRKFKDDNGLSYVLENIVISCGAKHSLYNLIQVLCNPGDEILIPTPYWVSYPEMVYLAGGKPVFVPTSQENGFRAGVEAVKKAVTPKSKILILNSPSNPTGGILEEKDLKALAQVVVENNWVCISDEIYEYYLYENQKHVSIASFNEEIKKRTFVVNGVSKSYSMTGLRIGYLAGDAEVVKKIGILQDHSTSNPASISQKMAVAALNLPKSHRENLRKIFTKRRELMLSLLAQCKGFKPFPPQGAFYVFCDISKTGFSSETLCEKLLEEIYVAVIPGKSFGSDQHVRFSFACSEKDIEEGIRRIKEWTEKNVK